MIKRIGSFFVHSSWKGENLDQLSKAGIARIVAEWDSKIQTLAGEGCLDFEDVRKIDAHYIQSLQDLIGKGVKIHGPGIRKHFAGVIETICPISVVGRACDPEGLCTLWCKNDRGLVLTAQHKISKIWVRRTP